MTDSTQTNFVENSGERMKRIKALISEAETYSSEYSFLDCRPARLKTKPLSTDSKTSSHNYPDQLKEIIESATPDWVLDCGSGSRKNVYNNVICFDIAPFDGVDVVGFAESLPFKTESFSVVFSLAVLEHVKDPIIAAREMQRVLKKNGILWIDVAFMQPYHGFPSHYYNMTHQGLTNLLNENMEIVQDNVPDYGTPMWSLTWFVSKYAAALNEVDRQEFLSLSLGDLLQHPETFRERGFYKQLPEQQRKELAATVSVIARKVSHC